MLVRALCALFVAVTAVFVDGWFVPASAGECYTVTIYTGAPNPPSVTVCPWD